MDKKIALSHIEKSRLLRQRLRTKKIQENAEKNFNDDNNQNNNEHSLNENIPLKTCKSSPITCNTSIKMFRNIRKNQSSLSMPKYEKNNKFISLKDNYKNFYYDNFNSIKMNQLDLINKKSVRLFIYFINI